MTNELTDEEHEALGAMLHRGKVEAMSSVERTTAADIAREEWAKLRDSVSAKDARIAELEATLKDIAEAASIAIDNNYLKFPK